MTMVGGVGKTGFGFSGKSRVGAGKAKPDAMTKATTEIFGTRQLFAVRAGQVFAATVSGQATRRRLEAIAASQIREREQLQGFRTNLSPAEKKKLASLQARIAKIEANAPPQGLGASAVRERADLFSEAYRILGKDWVDIEANPELAAINAEIETLREPQLDQVQQRRVDNLRKLKQTLTDRMKGGRTAQSTQTMFTRVVRQLNRLLPPRPIAKFTPDETRRYDELVARANAIAGQEILAPSAKQLRIESLQGSITSLQAQIVSLPGPDPAVSPGRAAAIYAGRGR